MMRKTIFVAILICCSGLLSGQNRIVQYEYWFNDAIYAKRLVQVAPTEELKLDALIDVSEMRTGYHVLHVRFGDSEGAWSQHMSRHFLNLGVLAAESPQLTHFEYWFGQDEENKHTIAIASDADIPVVLDLGDHPNGFLVINFRIGDAYGKWSPVQTRFVYKAGSGDHDKNLITEYRYWGGDAFNRATHVVLDTPQPMYALNAMVDMPRRTDETFNIQFRDVTGHWSVVYSESFAPKAGFDVFSTINTFTFENTTTFSNKYLWTFGDGSQSTGVHPTHTYAGPGEYEVCLIVENSLGRDTLCEYMVVKGIREVVANRGGNTGDATLHIYGGGFSNETIVYLEDAQGNKIQPDTTLWYKLDAIRATFDLRGKHIGLYNVVAEIEGAKYDLQNSFIIEQGTSPEPYVNIAGRSQMLFGRWQTYTLNFGNRGNVDATGVPLILIFSQPDGFDVEFPELVLNQNIHLKADAYYTDFKDLPDYFEIDNLFGELYDGRVYALYIPVIPANHNGSMRIRIKSNENVEMYAWVTEPYFMSPIDRKIENCIRIAMLKALKDGMVDLALGNMPVAGCIYSFWNKYLEAYAWEYVTPDAHPDYANRQISWGEYLFSWGNSALDLSVMVLNCAKDFVAPIKAYSVALQVTSLLNNIKGNYLTDRECREKYKPQSIENKKVTTVASFDPNEMAGPAGYREGNYTLNNRSYPYTIYYENLNTATAPAQEVVIIDTLDAARFDFSTFSFGAVSWQDKHITPLPGLKEFTLDYDLAPENPNILRINARFDEETGVAYWQLITLDPATKDLTEDPFGGFLPPNHNAPEGEGHVMFSVDLKEDLADGTRIENLADIFFDLNAPIRTNTYLNTIDITPPASALTSIHFNPNNPNLYAFTSTSHDTGSGVRQKVIYASVNGGAFNPMFVTSEEMFFIELMPDSVYHFFSLAVDSVGNTEPMKTQYEVTTLDAVVSAEERHLSEAIDNLKIGPNPATDHIWIQYTSAQDGLATVILFNALGVPVFSRTGQQVSTGNNAMTLDIGMVPPGIYLMRLETPGLIMHKKLLINR